LILRNRAAKGDVLGELPVQDGKRQTVALTVSEDLKVLAPKNRENDLQLVVADEKSLTAPVEQGTEAATPLVQLDGETLLSKPLVTAEAVPRAISLSASSAVLLLLSVV
jgi:D-alanyl-D-alanine carboxypeptidase